MNKFNEEKCGIWLREYGYSEIVMSTVRVMNFYKRFELIKYVMYDNLENEVDGEAFLLQSHHQI